MQVSRFFLITISVLLFSGCKKEDTSASATEDNCAITRSLHDGDVIPGQYIISYKTGVETTSAASTQITRRSRDVLQENNISSSAMQSAFTGELSGFVARLTEPEAEALSADPAIKTVEPDRFVALSTCFTVVAPTLITWNVNKVGYGNGIGKTAWIVDTGIDFDHPDLTVDVARSKSFISGQTSADDENGHGTHVAGIIGAKNNSIGVLGVASGATLVSLRVLDKDGTGSLSSIIEALSYVNANAKAGDVVNMSIGEDQVSETLDQQVKVTAAKGIYITIAAGNDSKSSNLFSPGRVNAKNVYTVSAVDSLDNFAGFSNYGNDVVDYAAPGVRILSTYKDGLYAKMSGTSMAAPHVAGLLLLEGSALHYSTTAKNDPDGTPDLIVYK
ncbi:MAG: S8 family serine peptidase [Flavisolibacter sp.]